GVGGARQSSAAQVPGGWGTWPIASGAATPADGIRVGADRSDPALEGLRTAARSGRSEIPRAYLLEVHRRTRAATAGESVLRAVGCATSTASIPRTNQNCFR